VFHDIRPRKICAPKSQSHSHTTTPRGLLYFTQRQDQIVKAIRELARSNPSDNKKAVDRIASLLGVQVRSARWANSTPSSNDFGDSCRSTSAVGEPQASFAARSLRHCVSPGRWRTCRAPSKTDACAARRPRHEVRHRAHAACHRGAAAWHGDLPRPITVFLVSDEEVGTIPRAKSPSPWQKSAGVLVLEPAAGLRGAVKTGAKAWANIRCACRASRRMPDSIPEKATARFLNWRARSLQSPS